MERLLQPLPSAAATAHPCSWSPLARCPICSYIALLSGLWLENCSSCALFLPFASVALCWALPKGSSKERLVPSRAVPSSLCSFRGATEPEAEVPPASCSGVRASHMYQGDSSHATARPLTATVDPEHLAKRTCVMVSRPQRGLQGLGGSPQSHVRYETAQFCYHIFLHTA